MDYLPSYLFPMSEKVITRHLVLGISLGGHAVWTALLHEPRLTAGVSIVGGLDYVNLMADRARLSKLSSWTNSDPPGSKFLGSEHFPTSLLEAVRKYDVAAFLLSHTNLPAKDAALKESPLPDPSEEDKQRLRPVLSRHLGGKRILQISGGADKLVPYHRYEAILAWLKKAIAPGGWCADANIHLEDLVFENVGHEFTAPMMAEVQRFIAETLSASGQQTAKSVVREARI